MVHINILLLFTGSASRAGLVLHDDEIIPHLEDSYGSRGFLRGPDDGYNHRQGATSSMRRVISLQGQSRARTAWAIPVRNPRAGTAPLLTVVMARWLQS